MSQFVLDCSVTMAWCFEDEKTKATDALLDSLTQREGIVPTIWVLEVSNVLLVAERKKRLQEADTTRFLTLLQNLPICVDTKTPEKAFHEVTSLARKHNLSSYDAAYLELAMRKGLPLATHDTTLKRIAKKLGITLLL